MSNHKQLASIQYLLTRMYTALTIIFVYSQATSLEGYYVSKPLMRSHRVLTLEARDASAHANLASPAGALLLLHTNLS